MMHLVLKINVHGHIDQRGLEMLRAQLQLKKQGRLTDDWDENFGNRRIEQPHGEVVKVALYRHSTDGSWTVNVSTTAAEFDETKIAALRAELIAGITAAGFEAEPRANPHYGP